MEQLAALWADAIREEAELACMMVDGDGFKQVNDTYGHDAGDQVLRELSAALRNAVRTDDLVCRLGGDEFFVLCPKTPMAHATQLAERIREHIAGLRVRVGGGTWVGSVSVGVAVRRADMTDPLALVKAADNAVYAAKRQGRNCVATSS